MSSPLPIPDGILANKEAEFRMHQVLAMG